MNLGEKSVKSCGNAARRIRHYREGIEPSATEAEIARQSGCNVINAFLTAVLMGEIIWYLFLHRYLYSFPIR